MTSPTARQQLRKAAGKSFQLDAQVLEFIHGEVRFAALKTITVSFNNPRIMELTDEMVRVNVRNRSKECREAIADRQKDGFKVTMISSAVEGDVTYSVTWKSEANLNVQAKIETLNNLAAELGAGADSISEHSIAAHGLIWGIIDDRWLAQKSSPLDIKEYVAPHERLIGPGSMGKINHDTDAPIVRSLDANNAHYRPPGTTDADMQRPEMPCPTCEEDSEVDAASLPPAQDD